MSTANHPSPTLTTRTLRRWALGAVAGNVALTVVAAAVLPAQAIAILPILGLGLALATTGVLDAALARNTQQPQH